jgi:hypothetical protein
MIHRDDGPAIEYLDGNKEYYKYGNRHSYNDVPSLDLGDMKLWYHNGKLHRDNDKPAVEHENDSREWYFNNMRHRDNDQPAVILPDGRLEYYIYGEQVRN